MTNLGSNSYVNGTSALKMPASRISQERPKFHAFSQRATRARSGERMHGNRSSYVRPESRLQRLLDSSEMFCSLKNEDARGCRFGSIATNDAVLLGAACSVAAIVTLLFGA